MHPITKKLVLGTAQFGSSYGIANQVGKPDRQHVFKILSLAWKHGINRFDTAPDYGSEKILGEFITAHGISDSVKVLTKIPAQTTKRGFKENINRILEDSLQFLQAPIDVLFFHSSIDSKYFQAEPTFFEDLVFQKPIRVLGASIYDPTELKAFSSQIMPVAYQFPYNVADPRFRMLTLCPYERYARSIFLQGVLSSASNLRANNQKQLVQFQQQYHQVLAQNGIDPVEFALAFVCMDKVADYYLVGVDSIEHLLQIIQSNWIDSSNVRSLLDHLPKVDSKVVDPRTW